MSGLGDHVFALHKLIYSDGILEPIRFFISVCVMHGVNKSSFMVVEKAVDYNFDGA